MLMKSPIGFPWVDRQRYTRDAGLEGEIPMKRKRIEKTKDPLAKLTDKGYRRKLA